VVQQDGVPVSSREEVAVNETETSRLHQGIERRDNTGDWEQRRTSSMQILETLHDSDEGERANR
jgi:hypothetical protein